MQNYFGTEPELDIGGLLRINAKKKLAEEQAQAPAPAPQEKPPSAIDNLLNMAKPMTPKERSIAEHGKGGHIARSIGGYILGDSDMFTKNDYKDQYKTDSARYKASSAIRENMPAFREYDAMMRDDDVGNDAEALYMMEKMFGVDDKLSSKMYGSYDDRNIKAPEADYQIINNNGTMVAVDRNNPNAIPIPLRDGNGALRQPMPQHQIQQVGAFDRMVPRLQELDQMELDGTTISRDKMTQLRSYETEDANGRILTAMGLQKWMSETLSPEERKYILAAEDAGMVVLRDESGAAISSGEILRQMNQYLMFDDYKEDGPNAFEAQRNARNRKAQTLATGLPDWLFEEDDPGAQKRKGYRDWVTNYNGARPKKYEGPTDFTGMSDDAADAAFEKMPKGTKYTGPDGVVRTK
jgi:hypothetical protein